VCSSDLYGHMIKGTPQQYISLGDQVEPGQIIGLMGDTGKVFGSKNKKGERIHCQDLPYDLSPFDETIKEGWGTHLHLELLTGNKFAGEKFTTIKPEPLGSANSVNLKKGVFTSYTTSSDLDGNYSKYHYGRYPYTLKLEKVYSITPLRASPGSSTSFELKGESFSEKSPLKIPFCNSQSFQFIDEHTAVITCQILGNGLAEGTFSNPDQPEGILKYQIDISSQSSGSPEISELNFITAKPGEFMNFHILGKNLPGDLKVVVVSKNFPGEEGVCDTKHSFSFLSPGSIKTQCRLPLNLGPVEQQNDQPFKVTVSHQGQVLASKDFEINYGISAANLLPRTALYYTPTRFTITGKNVHRTTVFFIEGCDKKDLKVISQKYDELVLECLIQPKPGTDLSTIQGKTFPHLFLFK